MPGLDGVPFLTNSSMMDVDFIPEHLIIVGGSYIGLEFGQMFRRFGSEVTIVEMGDRLIRREDEDVSAAILEILEGEGIHVRLNAKCISVSGQGTNIAAGVDCTAGAPEVSGTHLLLAVGRRPNTDDLGLDAAGIAATSTATSSWTTSCARTCRASGRSATATARARSPTRRSTTPRSSSPTCSRTIPVA